jgi:hypothetical protein
LEKNNLIPSILKTQKLSLVGLTISDTTN